GVVPPPNAWRTVVVTGMVSASTLYIYLTGAGDAYIDDIRLSVIYTNFTYTTNISGTTTNITTNSVAYLGTNVVLNGDFEQPLTTGWQFAGGNFLASKIVTSPVATGAG